VSIKTPYDVVSVNDDPEGYQYLTNAYFNWVYEPICDTNFIKLVPVGKEERNVAFMRDDSVGDPKKPDEGDNIQEISIPEGMDIFFPVYYFFSTIGEGDGKGGICGSLEGCMDAAKDDLSKLKTDENGNPMIWAKISINGKEPIDITSNFNDYTVTVSPFTITVGDNSLNREPEYHLKPGSHEGLVYGTFMYLRNFKNGEYVLYFGGEASNFITRSEYTMHVK
jgi:hypothetical protein